MLHEKIEGIANRNFRENKSNSDGSQRFIEGEDYFVLRKSQNNEIRGLETPNRGAVRYAKILDTDEAWEVYEELEENNNEEKIYKKVC